MTSTSSAGSAVLDPEVPKADRAGKRAVKAWRIPSARHGRRPARALGQPIERPKSVTTKMLEEAVAKTAQPA